MSTATKLEYLNDTKGLLKDSINSLGGNITSQTTFRDYATELDSIYASLPKVSGTGTNISLSPTLKGRLGSVLKGNTFQQTYTGKNLLPYENTTQTLYGVTITHNQDGSITINGTSTQGFSYHLFNENKKILDITKDYVLSTQIEMPDKSFLRLQNANNSNVFVDVKSETGTVTQKKYIKFNGRAINNENVKCFLYLYGNYTFNNYTIYPMLEEGTTMTSFEPYVGGTASPNPDYPQEIKSVTGLQKITISGGTGTTPQEYEINLGKNLFDGDFEIGGYDTGNGQKTASNDRIRCINYIKVEPNTTYTFSFENDGSAYFLEYDNSETYLNKYTLIMYHTKLGTITTSSNTKYITFYYIPYNHTLITDEQCQLEKGSQATSYSPYFTPIKLNKIGTYQDYITGTPNNWSIKRQIGSVILNGSERITHHSVSQGSLFRLYDVITDDSSDTTYTPLSNYYQGIPFSQQLNRSNNKFYIKQSEQELDIIDNRYTDVDDYKTWLSTHNVKIVYELATPTTTPITNTELISQLNALYYANSYNGITNISVEGDLPMILDVSALKGEE